MNTNTPKVTLFLLCYNQEEFIKESVASVLSQDYKNLRVVISDDNSSDKTFDIVKSLVKKYKGKAEILLNKNEENLGIGRHFAYIMDNFIDGELVVASAGDDISKSNRVSRIVDVWIKNNKPSLIVHSIEEIDDNGKKVTGQWTKKYQLQDHINQENNTLALKKYMENQVPMNYLGAAMAYSYETYSFFGTPKFYPDYEDHIMYFRSLLKNGIVYFSEKLIKYRVHEQGFSNSKSIHKLRKLKIKEFIKLNNKEIQERSFGTYRFQQILAQQWSDYKKSIKNNKTKIDYYVVSEIWKRIIESHKILIENKDTKLDYATPLKCIVYGSGDRGKRALLNLGSGFKIISFYHSKLKPHELEKIDCILVADFDYYIIKDKLINEDGFMENKIVRLPYSIVRPDI